MTIAKVFAARGLGVRARVWLVISAVVLAGCSDDPPPTPVPGPVIVSFQDGWGQIFVMDVDGSALRQVTPTVGDDVVDGLYGANPALSPDGRQLAYVRGSEIAVVDLDTGETRIVYEGIGFQPVYSPDGSTIAFANGSGINLMNTDGSDVRVIAEDDGPFMEAFSPDGSRVLYTVGGHILEVPVTGGEPEVLLRDEHWNADPVYSPDGSTLVFSSNRGGNSGSEIYSMPAGGGEIVPLTDTYAVHPEFTPDGSQIVYTRATTLSGELVTDVSASNRAELATMAPDGSDQRRLTPRSITAQMPSVGGGR